jgi:hypothetical protein
LSADRFDWNLVESAVRKVGGFVQAVDPVESSSQEATHALILSIPDPADVHRIVREVDEIPGLAVAAVERIPPPR